MITEKVFYWFILSRFTPNEGTISCAYCYHSVHVISFCLSQSDHIKQFSLFFSLDTSTAVCYSHSSLCNLILVLPIQQKLFNVITDNVINWLILSGMYVLVFQLLIVIILSMWSHKAVLTVPILLQWAPLNGITDNGINWLKSSNFIHLTIHKLTFPT